MDLTEFDCVIVNSSGGKDSVCALWEVMRLARSQGFDVNNVYVSHQDLGYMEWEGTKELAKQQADFFGLPDSNFFTSIRRDKNGNNETLLEYAYRRKKWPSSKQRWCTSDYKRGPGARTVVRITEGFGEIKVLYVFGFRAEESPARSKREVLTVNNRLTTQKRKVWDWLPIHDWSKEKVWHTIKEYKLPYHYAYDLGMPRLSCVFCIFSPFDALVLAGKNNPELLEEYVAVERAIGHKFREDCSMERVQAAVKSGYVPKVVQDWKM